MDSSKKRPFDFDKNVLISIFWPPTSEYINDGQYKLIADAGIDWVLGTGDGIGSKEDQLKMLELCAKYNIGMCVGDGRLGKNLLKMTEDEIKSLVGEYKDLPSAYGFYILDEPFNPNIFADAYKALKEACPTGYMHMNFMPAHAYASTETYESQMNDWLRLCEASGFHQDYLMYDMYPFPLEKGTILRTLMLKNLESVRKIGLKNNVRTAMYIQSVSQTVAFRSIDREETLFEMNMGLAFGIKQFSYFTWFTPYNRSEPFDDGIITHTGIPNKKYPFICEINKLVHNVGKTMIKLDAIEVFESKDTFEALELLPEDYFIKVKTGDLTVSHLKDKKAGRNYIMAVNNFFDKEQDVSVQFAAGINGLEYVSYEDGDLYSLPSDNGAVDLQLKAGEAVIIALPEGFDYTRKAQSISRNIAKDALITCTSSLGEDGWYMDNLNNGRRFAAFGVNGWKSNSKNGLDTVVFDFGAAREFNRIDLYPAGSGHAYGKYMPSDFTVSYSEDNINWHRIAKAKDLHIVENCAPSLRFNTVSGRYLKIGITGCNDCISEICEVEVYLDDGSLPSVELNKSELFPLDRSAAFVKYADGINLAKEKKVLVSSYPKDDEFVSEGWHPDFLVNEDENSGWTSEFKIHMGSNAASECAIVDLGDEFYIDRIEVYKRGYWPLDFKVSLSSDGSGYADIAQEKDCGEPVGPYVITPGKIHGRYIMFHATKLRGSVTDGFVLQLGEIKAFGRPYINKRYAAFALDLFIKRGGYENALSYITVKNALENKLTTQKEMNIFIREMLKEVGIEKGGIEEYACYAVHEYEFEYERS